jgi:lipoprotein-anchoring transpeptidase ErfK/SrfK
LVEAAAQNHADVLKLLLAASTDEKLRRKDGQDSATSALITSKDPAPVKVEEKKTEPVAEAATPVQAKPVLISPVAGALENGHEDLALQLLESGFEFKESLVHGQSLMAWSIATGQKRFFFKLLEKGVDPDTRLKTPASDAFTARVGNDNFHYYIKQDGNVTVLMLASALGETEMVDALLLKGARKNIGTTKHQTTAIYLAGINHHAAIVQMLLGKSAKPEDQHYKIEVSLSKQKATVYKDGKAVLNTPISSGRKGFSTPKGTFVITDKYQDWVSTIYDAEMPYFLRLNCGPVGLHAGALPGYPASHGCIRLPYEKAKEFYGTVDVGTIVSIVD